MPEPINPMEKTVEEWALYFDEQYRQNISSLVVTVRGLGPVEVNICTGQVHIAQESQFSQIHLFFSSEATVPYLDPIKQAIQLIAKRELLSFIDKDHPTLPLSEEQINTFLQQAQPTFEQFNINIQQINALDSLAKAEAMIASIKECMESTNRIKK